MATTWNNQNQAREDAWQYLYDAALDPRYSNQTAAALSDLSNAIGIQANQMAVNGQGTYDQNYNALQAQTGMADYNTLLQRLRDTGSLGVTDLGGKSLDSQLGSGIIGGYMNANGRPLDKWETVYLNDDGTYSIYDRRSRDQAYAAAKNAAEGGTAIDYSGSGEHSPEWQTVMQRYQNLYGGGSGIAPLDEAVRNVTVGEGVGISGDWSNGQTGGMGGMNGIAGVAGAGAAGYGGSGYGSGGTNYGNLLNSMSAGGGNAQSGWSYDKESDPVYQAYRDQYTRGAQQAMEDTLGQVSARTGGLASSYATQAAQAGYNQQMQALGDVIPTLYQDAYNRYVNERAYQDQQEEKAYQRALAAEQTAYERNQAAAKEAQAAQEDAYSQLMTMITKYGYTPTADELRAAGLSQSWLDAILGSAKKSTGGSYRSTGSTGTGKSSGTGAGTDETPTADQFSNEHAASANAYSDYLAAVRRMDSATGEKYVSSLNRTGRISDAQEVQIYQAMGWL